MASTLSFSDFTEDPFPVYDAPGDMDAAEVAFTPTDLIGDDTVQAVIVRSRPWIDPTDPAFEGGLQPASSGSLLNHQVMTAAKDAAIDTGYPILIPPSQEADFHYYFVDSVDLSDAEGIHIGSLGGSFHRGQFRRGGQAALAVAGGFTNPIFTGLGTGEGLSGFLFENLLMLGQAFDFKRVINGTYRGCAFEANGADVPMSFVNSWDHIFEGCTLTSKDFTSPACRLDADLATGGVNVCFLFQWNDCWFGKNGVQYRQLEQGTGAAYGFRFNNVIAENLHVAGSVLELGVASGCQGTFSQIKFDKYQHADQVGNAPILRLAASVGATAFFVDTVDFEQCRTYDAIQNFMQVDHAIVTSGLYDINTGLGHVTGPDGITEYAKVNGGRRHTTGGSEFISTSNSDLSSDSQQFAIPALAVRRAGDRHTNWAVGSDGTMRMGPTGATGSGSKYDTQFGRSDVNVLSLADGAFEFTEHADYAAPGANKGRVYARDNGAGKTQLVARFPSGAVQVIATEP